MQSRATFNGFLEKYLKMLLLYLVIKGDTSDSLLVSKSNSNNIRNKVTVLADEWFIIKLEKCLNSHSL